MGLTTLQVYYWSVLGIVISVLLPILRGLLPRPPGVLDANAAGAFLTALWVHARPYLAVGLFSLVTGVLIVAFTYGTLKDWRAAFLAGYAWDSTLQKIGKP